MNPQKTTDSIKDKLPLTPREIEENSSSVQLGLAIAIGVFTILFVATTAYFGSPFGYRLLLPH